MSRKVVWTPKVYAPHKNRDPLRWCRSGAHIFKAHYLQPKTKLCIYCQKEVVLTQ